MHIRVLFFGMLKDLAGRESDSLSLPDEATLADVLSHYQERIPQLKEFISSLATSVNQEYASPDTRLKANDEVALLPPVSGGSQGAGETPARQPAGPFDLAQGRRGRCASIVREKIVTQQIVEAIKRPEDGAVAVFEGIVRNHSRGRHPLYLDYEGPISGDRGTVEQCDKGTYRIIEENNEKLIVELFGEKLHGQAKFVAILGTAENCKFNFDVSE